MSTTEAREHADIAIQQTERVGELEHELESVFDRHAVWEELSGRLQWLNNTVPTPRHIGAVAATGISPRDLGRIADHGELLRDDILEYDEEDTPRARVEVVLRNFAGAFTLAQAVSLDEAIVLPDVVGEAFDYHKALLEFGDRSQHIRPNTDELSQTLDTLEQLLATGPTPRDVGLFLGLTLLSQDGEYLSERVCRVFNKYSVAGRALRDLSNTKGEDLGQEVIKNRTLRAGIMHAFLIEDDGNRSSFHPEGNHSTDSFSRFTTTTGAHEVAAAIIGKRSYLGPMFTNARAIEDILEIADSTFTTIKVAAAEKLVQGIAEELIRSNDALLDYREARYTGDETNDAAIETRTLEISQALHRRAQQVCRALLQTFGEYGVEMPTLQDPLPSPIDERIRRRYAFQIATATAESRRTIESRRRANRRELADIYQRWVTPRREHRNTDDGSVIFDLMKQGRLYISVPDSTARSITGFLIKLGEMVKIDADNDPWLEQLIADATREAELVDAIGDPDKNAFMTTAINWLQEYGDRLFGGSNPRPVALAGLAFSRYESASK